MDYFASPITVNFTITERCNSKCIFCGIKEERLSESYVSLDQIKRLIDIFRENKILRINFFGGEPFVYPFIREAIKYAKEQGFFVSAVTNGLNLTEDICKYLSKYINGIGISLHGFRNTHEKLMGVAGSFDRVLSSLQYVVNEKIPTGYNMTLTSQNYEEVLPLAEYVIDKYNIQFMVLNRFIPHKYLSEEVNKKLTPKISHLQKTVYDLQKLKIKYPDVGFKYAIHFPHCFVEDKELHTFIGKCGFGQSYCAVNMNGDFRMCSYTDHVLGNLFSDSFSEIWENHTYLKQYRSERWMLPKCRVCLEKETCMSGCKVTFADRLFSSDLLLKDGRE